MQGEQQGREVGPQPARPSPEFVVCQEQVGPSAGVQRGVNSLLLPLKINKAGSAWNCGSPPRQSPSGRRAWSPLLLCEAAGTDVALMNITLWPLRSGSKTLASGTDGAAGRGCRQNMCPVWLEGEPWAGSNGPWTSRHLQPQSFYSNGPWALGTHANSPGQAAPCSACTLQPAAGPQSAGAS